MHGFFWLLTIICSNKSAVSLRTRRLVSRISQFRRHTKSKLFVLWNHMYIKNESLTDLKNRHRLDQCVIFYGLIPLKITDRKGTMKTFLTIQWEDAHIFIPIQPFVTFYKIQIYCALSEHTKHRMLGKIGKYFINFSNNFQLSHVPSESGHRFSVIDNNIQRPKLFRCI